MGHRFLADEGIFSPGWDETAAGIKGEFGPKRDCSVNDANRDFKPKQCRDLRATVNVMETQHLIYDQVKRPVDET